MISAVVADLGFGSLAVAALAIFLGATLQGSVGFGLGLLAGPILIMIDPGFVPAPILLVGFPLTLGMVWRERKTADIRRVGWAMVGRAFGTGLGAAAVALIPARGLAIVFACVILGAVVVSLTGVTIAATRENLVVAGIISGITGTTSSVGGPPVALVYQSEKGPEVRGALSFYMAFGAGASLVGLWAVGRLGARELSMALLLLPALGLGFVASGYARHIVDDGYTRIAILLFATLAGLSILGRNLF